MADLPATSSTFSMPFQLVLRSVLALGCCLSLLGACSGSSGSGSSGSGFNASRLLLNGVSIAENAMLPLNQSIVLSFSEEIDFDSVDSTTIVISTAPGLVATGSFGPLLLDTDADGILDSVDERTVVWQPGCPLLPDNSDAGLGIGLAYTLRVRGTDSNSVNLLKSKSGRSLELTETRNFFTPASSDPAVLFGDSVLGAPQVRVRSIGSNAQSAVSYVELGGDSDPDTHLYFERDSASSQSLVVPGSALMGGVRVPLNTLSDPDSEVAFVVEFNQPVSPLASNISDDRIRIEYLLSAPGSLWTKIETDVLLLQNCSGTGAQVRLEPVGLLPPDVQVRVNVLTGFQGISGLFDSTLKSQSLFAVVDSAVLDHAPLANPGVGADELLEEFFVGGPGRDSLEDVQAQLVTPAALWGQGALTSTLNFAGAGGENGEFDWVIKQAPELFDTSIQTIQGGPNGELKYEQFTVGGIVDVHDFIIEAGAELQVRGPNPFVLNASGEIRIEGVLDISGGGARDVATLNTGSQPEPGGTGICGGGDGGTASEIRTNSTKRGGSGFSPFGIGKAGGFGGEFGYFDPSLSQSQRCPPHDRRPGGGGGGRFAGDQSDLTAASVKGPDPTPGMLAGAGNPGNAKALSAFDSTRVPFGGDPGLGPFVDGDAGNDFFGRRVDTDVAILMDGTAPQLQSVGGLITGELRGIHAGYGGGAGGDAGQGGRFPTPNWSVASDEKGGGGGGAGGAIRLRALGPIRFVGQGSLLSCRGARGATGENSLFVDRIGGSGGSGSGGHVILESATGIFFELPPLASRPSNQRRHVFVDARGLLGRVGAPTDGGGNVLPPDDSHGGDGGPGVIQLHVPNAIAPPHEDPTLSDLVLPEGTIQELNAGDENALLEVMRPAGIQMLPEFGSLSGSQSRWVDLRRADLRSDGTQNLLNFLFKGVDPDTGLVQTTNNRVTELAPILSGILDASMGSFAGSNGLVLSTLAIAPLINSVAPISDDLYLRAPKLLRNFILRMTPTIGVSLDFVVQDAAYDTSLQTLSLTVAALTGVDLGAFGNTASDPSFALIPRFFGISTGFANGSLPDGTQLRISFEGAQVDPNGNPDEANLLVPATSDMADFQALNPGELSFIRFNVEFNLDTLGSGVTVDTPPIVLDFLRLPFLY